MSATPIDNNFCVCILLSILIGFGLIKYPYTIIDTHGLYLMLILKFILIWLTFGIISYIHKLIRRSNSYIDPRKYIWLLLTNYTWTIITCFILGQLHLKNTISNDKGVKYIINISLTFVILDVIFAILKIVIAGCRRMNPFGAFTLTTIIYRVDTDNSAIINRLQSVAFSLNSTVDIDGTNKQLTFSEDNITCPICISDLEENNEVRILKCGHFGHRPHLDTWLNINMTCPICRYNIVDDSEDV